MKSISLVGISLVGISVLIFAAAFGDKAFSYEDVEENRRVIITQNGNADTDFSVTDGAGRSLEDEEFEDTKAMPYAVDAAVNTRVDFKKAVDAYIDTHIDVVALAVTPKLERLGMDSALYAYRQENIIFDGKNYQIHYVLLIQSQGDHVVLERRLIPEKPTFIAAYHIGQNTGDNYLPASIQPRGQNRLILALTDEYGATTPQIRQSATIAVTSSVASSATATITLIQSFTGTISQRTITTYDITTTTEYTTTVPIILTNDYSYISTSLSVSYGNFATATLTVGDHHISIRIDGNAYHPSKIGTINFSDAHRCAIGNSNKPNQITEANGLQYYDLTTGGETLQVARAICQTTGINLKDIVSNDTALSLGEVEGLIYVVVDNFSSPFPELSVIAIKGFVNTNTATVSCGYFKNSADHLQTELEAKFIPHAYISYYWVNPRTWDSQLLRTKKFDWDADSGIKEIKEATEDILKGNNTTVTSNETTVTVRFIAQANGAGTVAAGQIVLPVDWADVAEGQVVAGQIHNAANFSLNTLPTAVITSLDLGATETSYTNITIITNGLCKGKSYHCWGSTDESANLNSGFLHDLMMRMQLSVVSCLNNNFTAQIITEIGGPITKPNNSDWVVNKMRVPTKIENNNDLGWPYWAWQKAYRGSIGIDIEMLGDISPKITFIYGRTDHPHPYHPDKFAYQNFRFYIGGINPPGRAYPRCSGKGEINSPPPNSWVFPIVSTGKCANLVDEALYLEVALPSDVSPYIEGFLVDLDGDG